MISSATRSLVVRPLNPIWMWLLLLLLSSCHHSAENDESPKVTRKKFAQREEEIRFTSGQTKLAGTLFWPAAKADCPAVVILAAEWPLVETRVQQWEDDTWATLIGLAQQPKRDLNRQQKQALLDSFRQVIDQFKDQRWFATADVGNVLQRAVTLDVDNFFKLVQTPRYAQDWDGNLGDMSKIRCPVLAIWGQDDSFLPPNLASMKLKKALAESNHPDFRIEIFPDASHFLTKSDPTTEFVPGYLDAMTNWLGERFTLDDDDGK